MTRYIYLITLLALAALVPMPPVSAHAAASAAQLKQQLDELQATSAASHPAEYKAFLKAIADAYSVTDVHKLRGRVSVAYIGGTDVSAAPAFYTFAAPDEHHSAASTVKVVLLAALVRTIGAGQVAWEDKRGSRTLREHAQAMVRVSNNDSANAILGVWGITGVNTWLQGKLGFSASEIEFQRKFNSQAKPGPPDNYATAAALAKFYCLLAQDASLDNFPTAAGLKEARAMLSSRGKVNTEKGYNDRLNGKFSQDVEFIHKTGSNASIIGDGGIVVDGGREFIIVAFDTKSDRAAMARLGLNLLKLHRAAK